MNDRHTRISKFLSYVLRHRPDEIGLRLDEHGWAEVSDLLAACAERGRTITRDDLAYVVEHNDKRRFAFDDEGRRIRASQGHSVDVDLGYEPADPPELLYHGTAARFLEAIGREGLHKRARHHVHLSRDAATARAVGGRHGRPAVLEVRAGEMARAGVAFYVAANGVWLTDHVPPAFLRELERERSTARKDDTMERRYRPGGIGALMDEYERAARELSRVVEGVSDEAFEAIRDPHTSDENCRSIQTIMAHVVRAGYGYAEYIREALGLAGSRPDVAPRTRDECLGGVESFLAYTASVLDGRWRMSDDEVMAVRMHARWGPEYDLEQMLEHAIVHVLRHRRQIERFLSAETAATSAP